MVIPSIVFDVLLIPRVMHPDYPDYDHFRIMSKDKLMSAFCKRPSD